MNKETQGQPRTIGSEQTLGERGRVMTKRRQIESSLSEDEELLIQVTRENEKLRADKLRLDWLQQEPASIDYCTINDDTGVIFEVTDYQAASHVNCDLRKAIDAARKAQLSQPNAVELKPSRSMQFVDTQPSKSGATPCADS